MGKLFPDDFMGGSPLAKQFLLLLFTLNIQEVALDCYHVSLD